MGNTQFKHEPNKVNLRAIIVFGIGLFALMVLAYVLLWRIFDYFETREVKLDQITPVLLDASSVRGGVIRVLPPEPRLQTSPAQDMKKMHTSEDTILNSYDWVDQKVGIVRIPIKQAMKLLIEKGLPTGIASTDEKSKPGGDTGSGSLASEGQALFEEIGCNACHKIGSRGRGPNLEGVFGKPVPLESGETVVADENYLRESILNPSAKMVKGFRPLMPPYEGRIGQEELSKLIEYIKSLGNK
ncbi:MAG: c-type cytochrome [Nitrospira sp.]|nr:c-type cytochrome [Nitrospira sp.]